MVRHFPQGFWPDGPPLPTAEIVLGRLAQRLTGIPPESKRAVFMLPDYK